jgi:hypothetical protein
VRRSMKMVASRHPNGIAAVRTNYRGIGEACQIS